MAELRLGFPEPAKSRNPPFAVRRHLPVVGRRGMVCAAHPLVASAGIAALAKGGNAVDAIVAAGLAAAVVMPEMCGLGGDLFAIVHSGRPGDAPVAFLGGGAAPMGASLAMVRAAGAKGPDGSPRMPLRGPLSMGVPGMVDGYRALMERIGRLGFAAAAERAIDLADGAPISSLAYVALRVFGDVLDEAGRQAYMLGGAAPRPGSLAAQADLAATLRVLAKEGPRAFYDGDVARRIAAGVQAVGGALDASDLARHQTVVEAPIATTYGGRTVHQTGLPSQGLILLEALNIAEAGGLATLDGADAVHLMIEALKCAFADRIAHSGDPRLVPDATPMLISKRWGKDRLAAIDPARAQSEYRALELVPGDTTYICAADGDGMMVSLIQSVSSAFGSGIVAGDTGVLMNNRAGRGFSLEDDSPNLYAPGKRTVSTLNCYMVTDAAGAPVIAAGTPGGDGQPQWNLQVLHGLIDRGLDAQLAVEQPRWSVWPGTDPHNRPNPFHIFAEDRLGADVLDALTARGHVFQSRGDWGAEGAAQVIARDPATGVLVGGSDPRVEGMAIGL